MANGTDDDDARNISGSRTKLMREVGMQMDAIEADIGDDFEIGEVITIVQVIQPNGDVETRVRSIAPYLQGLGLLSVAERILHDKADKETEG